MPTPPPRPHPSGVRRPRVAASAALFVLLCAACGGEEPGNAPPTAPETVRPRTEDLLAALAARASDSGISDASWATQVGDLGLALWPDTRSPDQVAARRDHANLSHIAGDMAAQIAADPGAIEAWNERDPGSVRIHDAWLTAARAGPDAYRAWVVGAGRALLEERERAVFGGAPR